MLPELSARKALEIVRNGDPRGWAFGATQIEYDRALAILAALVDESEARDAFCASVLEKKRSFDANINAGARTHDAREKRRRLERGEES